MRTIRGFLWIAMLAVAGAGFYTVYGGLDGEVTVVSTVAGVLMMLFAVMGMLILATQSWRN